MHNPHKLNIDSNRNTRNIKIIKIAVKMPNCAEKICDMRTLPKYEKNAAACEICGTLAY